MGIAAMVIGIVSTILAFIPFCGMLAVIPAIVGLILAIVDVIVKNRSKKPKGHGIAGIVLNAVALLIILIYTLIFTATAFAVTEELHQEMQKMQQGAAQQQYPLSN